jgi:hypothetical protein
MERKYCHFIKSKLSAEENVYLVVQTKVKEEKAMCRGALTWAIHQAY